MLPNALNVIIFINENLTKRASSSYATMKDNIWQKFLYVGNTIVNYRKKWAYDTVNGSMHFHCIYSMSASDPTKLMT